MFGFSGEHLLVLLIILLIFGPRRLPDLGLSIGRAMKNFKEGVNGLNPMHEPEKPIAKAQIENKIAAPVNVQPAESVQPAQAAEVVEAEKV